MALKTVEHTQHNMTSSVNILSQRALRMEESATLRMAALARELKAKGKDVIDLSLGEPDFDTPTHIKEAAKQALDAGYTKYTPVPGLLELREAICTKFRRDNGLNFLPSQIVVSNGAKQSIANVCMAMLDPGDEVVILSPYWVSYAEIVKVAEGEPVIVHAGIEQDYKPTAEQIAAAITPSTKLLLFSSPCNPTGSVFSREELQAIAEVVSQHPGVYIVSDEIYEYINFSGEHVSIGSFEQVKDRTITINGFSKGFAMTGWRLGYMGAPKWIADACNKIQGQFTSGATAFSQKAAAYALLADLGPTREMCRAFQQRRDMVVELLSRIPSIKANMPQGAFYSFPDISALLGKRCGDRIIQNPDDFCEYLLENEYVAAVSGSAFGDDRCFRISFAASEAQLREAVIRIERAVRALV